jgi:hypothetical protein
MNFVYILSQCLLRPFKYVSLGVGRLHINETAKAWLTELRDSTIEDEYIHLAKYRLVPIVFEKNWSFRVGIINPNIIQTSLDVQDMES